MREKAGRMRGTGPLPHLSQATSSPAGGGAAGRRGRRPLRRDPAWRKVLPPAGEGGARRLPQAGRRMREKTGRMRGTGPLPHLSQATSSPAGGGTAGGRGRRPLRRDPAWRKVLPPAGEGGARRPPQAGRRMREKTGRMRGTGPLPHLLQSDILPRWGRNSGPPRASACGSRQIFVDRIPLLRV